MPQWTKDGKKFHATMLQVLDNHVIDYVPPEILMEKSVNLKNRTKEGLLGMAVVGALSSDPRLVKSLFLLIQFGYLYNLLNIIMIKVYFAIS